MIGKPGRVRPCQGATVPMSGSLNKSMRFKFSGSKPRVIDEIRFRWLRSFGLVGATGFLLLAFISCDHRRSAPEAVTLTFVDPERLYDLGQRQLMTDTVLQEFTRETGIRVNHLPALESNRDQLDLVRKLLNEGAATPDVFG